VERENPNGEMWSKMKLYLLCQVQALSYARYGSDEGLNKEHERRDQTQQQHKLRRHADNLHTMRKQTLTSTWLEKRTEHTHTYPPGDGVRVGGGWMPPSWNWIAFPRPQNRNTTPKKTSTVKGALPAASSTRMRRCEDV
jgi:hypothetical protein